MGGVLKVCGADNDGLDLLVVVELIVVAGEGDLFVGELRNVGGAFVATLAPNVRESDDFEIEAVSDLQEGGDQGAARAVGKTDDADADTIVGAHDAGIARGCGAEGSACDAGAREFQEIAP